MTPHLAVNRGYVLMQTKRYEQALNDFEFVIRIKPNYAPTLDYAAHCAFMIEDQVRGIKYAKEARKYGEPHTYHDWRMGAYKKQTTKYQSKS